MLLRNTQLERIKTAEPLWGHWTIGRQLGAGSFGSVYEAIDQKGIEPKAALKMMTVEFENQNEILHCGEPNRYLREKLERTISEIRRMVRFRDYPNFVTYHEFDYFEVRDMKGLLHGYDILIRMEKLLSLEEYYRDRRRNSGGKVSEADVLRLGIDICTGLRDAGSEAAFMHRDIKPENIFVSDRGVYKLGDLGLSGMNQSLRESICGTPLYMAPEIWMGKGYHANVDLYSLGLVMYELLNGNPPFGDTNEGIGKRLNGARIPRLASVSSSLADIIAKAVEFKPENRWQTAGEMLAALQNCGKKPVQTQKPVQAQKPAAVQRPAADKQNSNKRNNDQQNKPNNNGYIKNRIRAKENGFITGYEGETRNGVAHGKGKYTFADGSVLEGNWVNGNAHGQCRFIYRNGDIYTGEYVNGQRSGTGTFMRANGDFEIGEYINGQWCPDHSLDDLLDL